MSTAVLPSPPEPDRPGESEGQLIDAAMWDQVEETARQLELGHRMRPDRAWEVAIRALRGRRGEAD